jgi:hypothetical protein
MGVCVVISALNEYTRRWLQFEEWEPASEVRIWKESLLAELQAALLLSLAAPMVSGINNQPQDETSTTWCAEQDSFYG